MDKTGGYGKIYRDLLDGLKSVDLAQAAKVLDLSYNPAGQVGLDLLGTPYLIENSGIHQEDGKAAATSHPFS